EAGTTTHSPALPLAALQLSHAFFLPKLEELLDEKKHKEQLKKLDFLNLFAEKEEKKLSEWEKLKEWFEEKKLKELNFFENKKEKFFEELEDKLKDKLAKKTKAKSKAATTAACYEPEAATEAAYVPKYQRQQQQQEEEEEEEEVVAAPAPAPAPCACKTSNSYNSYVPTAYDVREDYEEGVRYFT
ncbi:hypothetical protein KR222_000852, partial [Zaprionus bogoriensis]